MRCFTWLIHMHAAADCMVLPQHVLDIRSALSSAAQVQRPCAGSASGRQQQQMSGTVSLHGLQLNSYLSPNNTALLSSQSSFGSRARLQGPLLHLEVRLACELLIAPVSGS